MPHQLDVACPNCRHRAEFEFAEVVRIGLKSDIEFFQNASMFEYQTFQDSCGHIWHGAIFFQGLHGSPHRAIGELPAGYSIQDWEHSKYLREARHSHIGSIRCANCSTRSKHRLSWPNDAYYSIPYRSDILWAYHRESAVELHAYLLSISRDVSKFRWASFLLHVPTVFKKHKASESISKQLAKALAS